MPPSTLLIMRHADAEHGRAGQPDEQRELTSEGHQRAAAQADLIARHAPQLVLCSAAVRATQTLSHLDVGAAVVHVEPELYGASATELLRRLGEVEDAITSLLVVGHMPTVAEAAVALVGDRPPGEGASASGPATADVARLRTRGFRPGDVAVLALPDRWVDLRPGRAQLQHFG